MKLLKTLIFTPFLLISIAFSTVSLKVGIYDNEPLVFTNSDGSIQGIYIDIMNYISEQEKWNIQYVHGSWAEGLERLKNNQIDILLGIAFSLERNNIFDYNEISIINNWAQIYIPEKSDIKSMLDLQGKKIAVQKADIYFQSLKSFGEVLNINSEYVEVDDYEEILKLVSNEKVDAGLVPRIFGQYHENRYPVHRSFINFKPVELRIASPKGKLKNILSVIDNHLIRLKNNKNSYYYQSLNQWIEGVNKLVIPKWMNPLWTLLIVLGIILLIVTLNIIFKWQVTVRTRALRQTLSDKEAIEISLRKSEYNYRSILEQASDGIFILSQEGKYIDVNLEGTQLTGLQKEEILNRKTFDLMPVEDTELNRELQNQLEEGNTVVFEKDLIQKDGELIPVEISARKLEDGRFQAIVRDITSRKEAEKEKEKLEEQLRRSQKLETIGTLAGGIAHDFNNILTPIMGFSEMCLMNMSEANPLYNKLEQILTASHRGRNLVEQILLFSKQSEKDMHSFNLPPLIKEALKLLRPSIPSSVEIKQEIDSSCGNVMAEPIQIHQVIVNLCTNAWQAMKDTGGLLTIRLEQVHVDLATSKLFSHITEGNYARLSIIDTGIGITAEIQEHIFDPFFTTKKLDEGTGLGLSVVHGIIRNHHGDILVDSTPKHGSAFHIYLPIVQAEAEITDLDEFQTIPGNERILAVDDDNIVSNLIKEMLESFGYSVHMFSSSLKALEAVKNNPGNYDAVISDMTMPDMTGLDLAKHIKEINPNLPILIITGNTGLITKDDMITSGVKKVVGKPIEMKDFSKAVRDLLDNSD